MIKTESIEILPSGRVAIFVSGLGHSETMFSPESAEYTAKLLLEAVKKAQDMVRQNVGNEQYLFACYP